MDDNVRERRIAGLTIRIDRDLCIGTQSCINVAPEVFGLDDTQTVVVLDDAKAIARERLADACTSCPVAALTLLDEKGEQVAP